jgi:hypothetical protein
MTTQQQELTSTELDPGGALTERQPWWETPRLQKLRQRLGERLGQFSWQTWALILVLTSGGIGFTATALLLKLPENPNCPRVFWPIASASMRIYCAQLEADAGTVDSLLRAIELVANLPQDHPLRGEIDRNVEDWASQILDLAEKEFQAGDLAEAIATARKIPSHLKAHSLIQERIERWQSIWSEGEAIFAAVEKQLLDSEWNQAFREAVKLLNLDNEYWATTKYDETVKRISLAQEDSKQLDSAYAMLHRGGFDNWLKAIEEAGKISQESYAYQEAQKVIDKAKDKLVAYVQELIDNRSWQRLEAVADRIPERLGLEKEVADWRTLARAGSDAEVGTPESIESAIATVGQIEASSPLYQKAQELSGRWKLEIEDVARLAKARDLAGGGNLSELNAAISEAAQVPDANPRYQEAQGEIRGWNRQIQTIEDQPYLERAQQLAQSGSIPDLQAAIAQASSITANRALYREAQKQIGNWQYQIQLQEDQPYLDRAIAFGNAKDYQAAIDAASQIRRGRALYPEARTQMKRWQREVQAKRNLEQAYLVAQAKTPEALVSAISILRNIPASAEVKEQGDMALNRWSYQLLAMANARASATAFAEAINLAKLVPRDSAAYDSAQAQIAVWKDYLQPPSLPVTAPPLVKTGFPEGNDGSNKL